MKSFISSFVSYSNERVINKIGIPSRNYFITRYTFYFAIESLIQTFIFIAFTTTFINCFRIPFYYELFSACAFQHENHQRFWYECLDDTSWSMFYFPCCDCCMFTTYLLLTLSMTFWVLHSWPLHNTWIYSSYWLVHYFHSTYKCFSPRMFNLINIFSYYWKFCLAVIFMSRYILQ